MAGEAEEMEGVRPEGEGVAGRVDGARGQGEGRASRKVGMAGAVAVGGGGSGLACRACTLPSACELLHV